MRALLLSMLLLVSLGCGGDDRRPAARPDSSVSPDAASADDAGAVDATIRPPFDAGDGLDDVQVWAHSPRELYRFDPRTNEVSFVGRFVDAAGAPADDMTDLAVDGFGNLYTCSFTDLYRVDPSTAVVTRVGSLGDGAFARFNALTFAPAGELDPSSEVLIAANAEGDFYRVDPTTGASASIGQFSDGFGSSGDIVSVLGAGTFVTAFREDLTSDWLIRVDLRTGVATPVGATGTTRLFGLAYWRNRLYGFNSLGWLYVIDVDTGRATRVTGDTGASTFFGAGVTTNAPTAPI
ncbi:MAG: hypothetical protein KF901_30585 [Myxococcales bacterium]|nr:hypothetical protein [Myxococcales bacterium]